jgi:hypothetical protein
LVVFGTNFSASTDNRKRSNFVVSLNEALGAGRTTDWLTAENPQQRPLSIRTGTVD